MTEALRTEWIGKLREYAASMGVSLSTEAATLLVVHWEQVEEANRWMNLTSIPVSEALVLHYLDSLSVLRVYRGVGRAVDLGSGAGYPGLVLAVIYPASLWVLVEATAKKAEFLRGAVQTLGLAGVTVVNERAERAARRLGASFDWVVARAIGSLSLTAELGLPILRRGGRLIAMRGPAGEDEVTRCQDALHTLGGVVECVAKLELPGGAGARTLVVVQKGTDTPLKFPRVGGALGRF